MARSRNIKPGFFTNEDLVELDFATRLLFAGLWTVADRDGRLQDRPKKIKIELFPADNVDIDVMLQALHDAKFIVRYEVNGEKYVQIATWSKHQNPHHTEKASEIPGLNGEITVKEPLKPLHSTKQDGGNLADSLLLIPDSLNKKEPNGSVSRTSLPTCPSQKIIDLYHEVLPELPAVRLETEDRKKALPKFWKFVLTSKRSDGTQRAHNSKEALDWIRGYFERARNNDFLMGKGQKVAGHESWTCNLDFLMTDKGKKQVIEKTREVA